MTSYINIIVYRTFLSDFKGWSGARPKSLGACERSLERQAESVESETTVAIVTAQVDLLMKKRNLPGLFPNVAVAEEARVQSVADLVMRHRLCKICHVKIA
jgi:hypothetical protein